MELQSLELAAHKSDLSSNHGLFCLEKNQGSNDDLCFNSLGEVLAYWAKVKPDGKAYTMLNANGLEDSCITYGELHSQALNVARCLLSQGLRSRNVVLLYPPGIEFIVGFFGCLYAGVVPAPIHTPKRNRSNQKIANLVLCANAAAILLPEAQKQEFRNILMKEENWPKDLMYVSTDAISELPTYGEGQLPKIDGSMLAFLQFTSGSTSLPKGVMISHQNCLNNIEMIVSMSQITSSCTTVSWLPHHHDLGLVAHLLHSIYSGGHCVILAPTTFVSQPIQWLRAITKYRAEYTGGPNFAYQLCIDKIPTTEQQNLDLSSLRMVINAAEPVNPQTLWDFSQKFAKNGFKSQMFLPAYGMAEATVFISSGFVDGEPVFKTVDWTKLSTDNIASDPINGAKEKVFIGCGHAWLDQEVHIFNPDLSYKVPPNHIGEIWVTGSNVMSGYYNNSEATAKTLVSVEGDHRLYLRTGDLGFMDDKGELYITGRLKDMMIINGVNYYPQDIELCVEQAHRDIRSSGVIAFSVSGATGEELVIVAELNKAGITKMKQSGYLEELVEAISSKVGEQFELSLNQLIFLKIGRIPKTSSGKLRRQQCKQECLQGIPDALATWTQYDSTNQSQEAVDTENLEKTFQEIMSMGFTHLKVFTNLIKILTNEYEVKMVDFDLEKSMLVYGIESSQLMEIRCQLEKQLECPIPVEVFSQENNVKGLLNDIVCAMFNHNN
ncbi:AMP-binding protein [Aphanothece sacrum]|uniref:AMP-dependent synthetase and ligase n=1 Tax=Aphanothece sacrum FPU1 TaxID=1920663 RepID=A0A401IM67_APHSA|nr:AMP-binding protein [Aphanothece sacrum]GBF82341.1 AMP-dependent synthetase and ligase [Aphanothece sacrum FPU1]GBF84241.1 AMP-dependent synthetase and ligase [Aphanothece sacrum FPU3]